MSAYMRVPQISAHTSKLNASQARSQAMHRLPGELRCYLANALVTSVALCVPVLTMSGLTLVAYELSLAANLRYKALQASMQARQYLNLSYTSNKLEQS